MLLEQRAELLRHAESTLGPTATTDEVERLYDDLRERERERPVRGVVMALLILLVLLLTAVVVVAVVEARAG